MEPHRIEVTDVLDLHSVPPRDVKPVVEEYLSEARRLGLRAIRIIHGKGIGVQREMVRTVLSRTPWVKAFGDGPDRGSTVADLAPDQAADPEVGWIDP